MASHGADGARRRPPGGAVLPDGRLNVSLLQREIATDLSNDARYRAEDDMKKRAIHSSKDYDEFRKFVSASQLKPVGRSDVADLFSGANGNGGVAKGAPRNKSFRSSGGAGGDRLKRGAEKKSEGGGGKGEGAGSLQSSGWSESGPGTINTPAAFEREWRRRGCSSSPSSSLSSAASILILGLLAEMIPEDAPTGAFRVEIDADVLGGIVCALGYLVKEANGDGEGVAVAKLAELDAGLSRLFLSDGEAHAPKDGCVGSSAKDARPDCSAIANFVYRWMAALTKCARFDLAAAFLDDERKEDAKRVCDFLSLSEGCAVAEIGGGGDQRQGTGKEVGDDDGQVFTREDVERIRRAFLG